MELSELCYIDDTGYHFADYPSYLAYFTDKYKGIYGADVNLEPDTQDGQWIAIQAKAAYDTAALGASTYNSFSPVTAQGVGLSRNVKINGINRQAATNSTVDLLITGQAGTVITDGVAIDDFDQKWNLPASVTIPGGGTITVTATAQELGDLEAAPNTVNRIYTPTLGWQSVNNATAATPGRAIETDAELRIRQADSTANPSQTVLDGTTGALQDLDGVQNAKVYENDTDTTDSNGIPSHSIAAVVQGGDNVEIANAIAVHKTPGTGTYGSSSEVVFDAHGMPLTIRFQRPTVIQIIAQITIAVFPGYTSDYEPLIKQAVADTINALGIGETVLITKLYIPAYLPGTPASATFDIISIEIAKDGDPLGTINVPLDFDEIADCDIADIVLVVT